MSCKCRKEIDEQLAEIGQRLRIGFGIDSEDALVARLVVASEWLPGREPRKALSCVYVRYCPFCGVKA